MSRPSLFHVRTLLYTLRQVTKVDPDLICIPHIRNMKALDRLRSFLSDPYDKYQTNAHYLRGRVQQEMLQMHGE